MNVRELSMVLKPKNSAWKLKDGEQWKGRRKYKTEHQVRLKLVQYCIQLTIAKNENFFKRITFLVYGSMFVYSYCTTWIFWNFVFVYISQINFSESSATQWVFNLKSKSKSSRIKFGILMQCNIT